MKRAAVAVAAGLLLTGTPWATHGAAQTPGTPFRGCVESARLPDFTIHDARLSDPFWILRWRKVSAPTVAAIERLKGTRYTFAAVNDVSKQIESEAWRLGGTDGWVAMQYSAIAIDNCADQQLDVVFTIFSAAVSPTLSALFEWGSSERTPDEIAGLARTRAAWQFAPEASFDRAREMTAGGRGRVTWTASGVPFGALDARAVGSTESHDLSASLVGEHEWGTRWIRQANWRVVFEDSSAPTSNNHLDRRRAGVQFAATSRPIKGTVARFGGALDGGRLRSGFTASELPAQTVSDSRFTSASLFGGVTARGHRQAFKASYALVLGSTGSGFHGDWRTHIGDLAHELWLPVAHHRLVEIEQRLTVGRLQTIDVVPVTERFFGGADNQNLLLGEDWHLRAAPVVRSIPTNGFPLDEAGAGGERFAAYNLTGAFTLWGKPVVPKELLDDDQFNRALQGQLVSARSTLDVLYQSDDPRFRAIKDRMPEVVAILQRIGSASAAARTVGALPAAALNPCEDALQSSRAAAGHVVGDSPFQAMGWVQEMLPEGGAALDAVVSACGMELVAAMKRVGAETGELESATGNLRVSASAIGASFAAIDTRKSRQRADNDIGYAERALGVITRQMNITSISPVFLFDMAHIGPAGNHPHGGNRFAVGGGLRFTLLSTVNLTATYAVNPRRGPGEGSGALVFSLTTRNLFD